MTTPSPASDPKLLTSVQTIWAKNLTGSPIYSFLLTPLTFTYASKGTIRARLILTKAHLNSKGGLHGSVSATIVDAFGGLAIMSYDLRERTGASVDINVTYLGSVGEGDEVEIEGVADRVGGSLGFTSVKISKVVNGEVDGLIVQGRHTKFVRGTAPEVKK